MEQIVIRNLPAVTKAALAVRAARHGHSAEAEARAILTAALSPEDVPISVLLAADTDDDIDFEPDRLPLRARTPELCPTEMPTRHQGGLGSRIASRFRGCGLTNEIP